MKQLSAEVVALQEAQLSWIVPQAEVAPAAFR